MIQEKKLDFTKDNIPASASLASEILGKDKQRKNNAKIIIVFVFGSICVILLFSF